MPSQGGKPSLPLLPRSQVSTALWTQLFPSPSIPVLPQSPAVSAAQQAQLACGNTFLVHIFLCPFPPAHPASRGAWESFCAPERARGGVWNYQQLLDSAEYQSQALGSPHCCSSPGEAEANKLALKGLSPFLPCIQHHTFLSLSHCRVGTGLPGVAWRRAEQGVSVV